MTNDEVERKREPIEPHWPWGSIAFLEIRRAEPTAGWYEVVEVTKTQDGWEVVATRPGLAVDLVFDVDEDGESANCIPWDQDVDSQFIEYHNLMDGPLAELDKLDHPSWEKMLAARDVADAPLDSAELRLPNVAGR